MKIIDILKTHNQGIALEFFPPKTEAGRNSLAQAVESLNKYNPFYVSMTYGAGGTTQERTKDAVSLLLEKEGLVVMPHLTCIGAKEDKINTLLEEYKAQGIENIMALRGDIPPLSSSLDSEPKDFCFAKDLVKVIKQHNHFCLAIAVYPEGHIETSSLDQDTEYTKQKIEAGADFGVTQMFFDNTYFYSFIDRMKKNNISLPILPGILPLTSLKKVKEFSSFCRTTIPRKVEEAMARFAGNPQDEAKAGIELTINQCRALKQQGFKRLHFFALNKAKAIETIMEAL
jgi:methylenetetrahydrofolate reductase (NADPH)